MFKKILSLILIFILTLLIAGCDFIIGKPTNDDVSKNEGTHIHTWVSATCTVPMRCTECGEITGIAAGHIFVEGKCSVCGAAESEDDGGDGTTTIPEFMPISEFIELANGLAVGERSSIKYTIKGTVLSISNTTYGNMTVSDGTGSILIRGTWNNDGTVRYDSLTEKPEVGDTVELYGVAYHFNASTIEMENAWLMGLTKPTGDATPSHDYTDFTSDEKALFEEYFGLVVPFIPNDAYDIEDYSVGTEYFLYFYTLGNTRAEFNAYRNGFSSYTYIGEDDYEGIKWYTYQKGNVIVELSYYIDVDNYECTDVYVYIDTETDGDSGSGSGGDSGSSGGNIGGGNLPAGTDGVYDVDFTEATNVKDVTDQGYYLDGCPTVGSPGVLVIPVDFSDRQASSLGYDTSVIANAFGKNGVTDYYSVYDYYYISSYGKLTPNITVLDYWFRPQYASTYYESQTANIDGTSMEIGDQMIIDEALKYLEPIMDLSQFDSDKNGIIDAVIIINTLEIDADTNFRWAYRYWNYYTDDDGYYYEYDGVSANDYLWASYLFMHEDDNGNYTDKNAVNTYTYIHEFGHILGVDDYYDTTGENHPMNGLDIMDGMVGDHNAYSKFNLGWLTTSRLVTTDTSVTLSLKDFSKNGDTIIIANKWDTELGAYQEYYIIVYYKATGLNGTVNGVDYGYFEHDGIIVYHVNAKLYSEVIDGVTYYDVYNNNSTPDGEYGTEDNLIEFVQSGSGNYTYAVGDALPSVKDDNGTQLGYTFRVDSLGTNEATLTFTKI